MWYIDNQHSLLAQVSLSCCRGHYEIVRIASSLPFTLLSPPLPSVCHVSSQALVNFDKTLIKSFFCQQYNVKDMQPRKSRCLKFWWNLICTLLITGAGERVRSTVTGVWSLDQSEGSIFSSGPIRWLHFQFWPKGSHNFGFHRVLIWSWREWRVWVVRWLVRSSWGFSLALSATASPT